MYVPFNELPDSSKIWVFQSDREFSSDDLDYLNSELKAFTEDWVAHSASLKASFDVRYKHFIILSVDESVNDASGCSVDNSVRIIKKIGAALNIDFFKRENIAFLGDHEINLIDLSKMKNEIKNSEITIHSICFNNQITTKHDLVGNWKVPVRTTWLSKYFL